MKHALAAMTLFAASLVALPALAQQGCRDCGVVRSIQQVEQKGGSSGGGAVIGGVLGGVLGHQIGSGRGNTVATIAGAAGGAVVGNEVERNRNTKTSWEVRIAMDSGDWRTLRYSAQPVVREGDRVRLVDNGRSLALVRN